MIKFPSNSPFSWWRPDEVARPTLGIVFPQPALHPMKPHHLLIFTSLPFLAVTVSAQNTHSMSAQSMAMDALSAVWPNLNPPEPPQTQYFDGVDLYTNQGDVFKVDQSLRFSSSTLKSVYTRFSMTSNEPTRVSASWQATDEFTLPVNDPRQFIVRDFTLNKVDLNLGNIQFGLQPENGETAHLTLHDSSLAVGSSMTLFYHPSPLKFTVTGNSEIASWTGSVASRTDLDVISGGTLRIKDSGAFGPVAPSSKLNFGEYSNRGQFDNGASLLIDNSAVLWGKSTFGDDTKDSSLSFRNGSHLQLGGLADSHSTLDADIVSLENSTLTMVNGTRLNLHHALHLDNSTVSIGTGALADVDQGTHTVHVRGSSVVTINSPGGTGLRTAFLDLSDINGAALTLKGEGVTTVSRGLLYPFDGTTQSAVHVEDDAMLELASVSDTILDGRSILTTGSTGAIDVRGYAGVRVETGATFTNGGVSTIRENAVLGASGSAFIGGGGDMEISAQLNFDSRAGHGAQNSLTTTNDLSLQFSSIVTMHLDAVALRNDHLIVNSANAHGRLDIDSSAVLDLRLWRDAPLAIGTRFELIEYPASQDGVGYFRGLPDGADLLLGLNTYEINYNDPAVLSGKSKFITLTVVPEPSSALLGIGALAIFCSWRRRTTNS
jgi:hypothetical protein